MNKNETTVIRVRDLSFAYEDQDVLKNIDLDFKQGQMSVICGKNGCGKSTLLKLMKREIAPVGNRNGTIEFPGSSDSLNIGFLFQNPDFQCVCHDVIHELAFGLENMGVPASRMSRMIAETVSFFNLHDLLHRPLDSLSGGQKQIVSLAAVMACRPDILLLDEPVSQLDPISASNLLSMIERIHQETGVTVIVAEHDLEHMMPLCERVILLEDGHVVYDGTPMNMVEAGDFEQALPCGMQLGHLLDVFPLPVTFEQSRCLIREYQKDLSVRPKRKKQIGTDILRINNVHFSYPETDVLKGVSLSLHEHEILAVAGSNGCGKSTLLKVICGLLKPERGTIRLEGMDVRKMKDPFESCFAWLPQDPYTLFVHDTLREEMNSPCALELIRMTGMENVLDRHPYDLSGGQLQMAALISVICQHPRIVLLDEPCKGIDAIWKRKISELLKQISELTSILLVSHDLEFCAETADRMTMMSDGRCTDVEDTAVFLEDNMFYTTTAARITKGILNGVHTAGDIVYEKKQ